MTRGLTIKNDWRHAEPELKGSTRLLLLLSRVELDEEQSLRARELCARIDDWDDFARSAAEYFIAPLCLYHLGRIGEGEWFQPAREALVRCAMPMTLKTLSLAALQRRFIERYVLPLEASFAVLKGRALGARYYPEAGLRFARDLDILVPVEHIPALVMAAQKDGYRIYPERRLMKIDEAHIVARQSKVVTLLGSDGILIEVHVQLDKAGFLLDHRGMMERAETIEIDGLSTRVLTTADHFVYICLHHTKHFWSRLNWLADLDALVRSSDFDRSEVMALARARGVEKTVAACLKFYQVCGTEDPWKQAGDQAEVMDLLRACLVILDQGAATEFEMRPDRLSLDFNFEWQFPDGFERRRRWNVRLASLRPSVADYRAMPLPRAWHWLYFATRPVRLLLRRETAQ